MCIYTYIYIYTYRDDFIYLFYVLVDIKVEHAYDIMCAHTYIPCCFLCMLYAHIYTPPPFNKKSYLRTETKLSFLIYERTGEPFLGNLPGGETLKSFLKNAVQDKYTQKAITNNGLFRFPRCSKCYKNVSF